VCQPTCPHNQLAPTSPIRDQTNIESETEFIIRYLNTGTYHNDSGDDDDDDDMTLL